MTLGSKRRKKKRYLSQKSELVTVWLEAVHNLQCKNLLDTYCFESMTFVCIEQCPILQLGSVQHAKAHSGCLR